MAIGLEPESSSYAWVHQKGEFELCMGGNKDGTPKGTLILNKNNIVAFKRLIEGVMEKVNQLRKSKSM